jgi:hypothetical protein
MFHRAMSPTENARFFLEIPDLNSDVIIPIFGLNPYLKSLAALANDFK